MEYTLLSQFCLTAILYTKLKLSYPPKHEYRHTSTVDNAYGAVIMTKVIVKLHPVHLMNADSTEWPPTRRPSQPTWWAVTGVRRNKGSYHPQFTIAFCYYYSANKLILILPSHGRWQAESTYRHCSKGAARSQGDISHWTRDKHNRPAAVRFEPGSLTPQLDALTTRPLRQRH